MDEFEKYKVGKPSTRKDWTNNDCVPFNDIYHVSHLESAYRIIEDKKIRSGLVFDESKLTTERITVSWLSPNTWAYGSRYGNVEFTFDFKELIRDKNYYWIESVDYKIAACRILISEKDYTSKFKVYDPKKKTGPWWFDTKNDQHYHNNDITLEIMIDEDLITSNVTKLRFTHHHANFCNVDHSTCPDMGLSLDDAIGFFFARYLSNKYYSSGPLSIEEWYLKRGLVNVSCIVKPEHFIGTLKASDPSLDFVLNALLYCHSRKQKKAVRYFASMIESIQEYRDALRSLFESAFGITIAKKEIEKYF